MIRLLNPQQLDRIWSGLTPCRLPFDTISEYPEKIQEVREKGLASFSVPNKNRVPDMGGNSVTNLRVQEFLPPMPGTLFFFQNTKTGKSYLSLPEFFQDQGSGHSLRVVGLLLYSSRDCVASVSSSSC